jgi:hypothetical protein
MVAAPRWSEAELARDAGEAAALFREERLGEPLEQWLNEYDTRVAEFRRLFTDYSFDRPWELTAQDVVTIFEGGLGDALRYLAGPPISADDLRTLAEVRSLKPNELSSNGFAGANGLLEIFQTTLDPRRFPWVATRREPMQAEIDIAVASSAALIAGQRVQTHRRNKGKSQQEGAVKSYLRSIKLTEEHTRRIETLDDAPPRGAFCAESLVGTRKADVPVRLFDGRLLPIECKVSNSALNSIKRINNDAAIKARIWRAEFGTNQVVPAAMLSGVFDVNNLVRAQDGELTLFWAHRLSDLGDFIDRTRNA